MMSHSPSTFNTTATISSNDDNNYGKDRVYSYSHFNKHFTAANQSAYRVKVQIHTAINAHIDQSPTSSLTPLELFGIFHEFCTNRLLLEKLREFCTANTQFSYNREEAIVFVDQLIEFSNTLYPNDLVISSSSSSSSSLSSASNISYSKDDQYNDKLSNELSSHDHLTNLANMSNLASKLKTCEFELEKAKEREKSLHQQLKTQEDIIVHLNGDLSKLHLTHDHIKNNKSLQSNFDSIDKESSYYLEEINRLNDRILELEIEIKSKASDPSTILHTSTDPFYPKINPEKPTVNGGGDVEKSLLYQKIINPSICSFYREASTLASLSEEDSLEQLNDDGIVHKINALATSLRDRQNYINELSILIDAVKSNIIPSIDANDIEPFLRSVHSHLSHDQKHFKKLQILLEFLIKKNEQLYQANRHFVTNLQGIQQKLRPFFDIGRRWDRMKSICAFLFQTLSEQQKLIDKITLDKEPRSTHGTIVDVCHADDVYNSSPSAMNFPIRKICFLLFFSILCYCFTVYLYINGDSGSMVEEIEGYSNLIPPIS